MTDTGWPHTEGFAAWRGQLLDTVLRIVLVLGALVAVPSIVFAIVVREPLIVIVDVAALAALAFVTFRPTLSYRTRALTLMVLAYLLGLFLLTVLGIVGQLYLLAFPVFAGVLLGLRPALIALAINAVTLMAAGFLDVFDTPVAIGGIDGPLEWALVVLNFLFVNTAVAVFCGVLLGRLQRSLADEQATSTSLEQQRASLTRTNQELEREVEERRRAEAEVQRFAAAVAQARDVIVIGDPGGRIVYTNHAYDELAADTITTLDGDLLDLWRRPEDRAEVRAAMAGGTDWAGPLPLPSERAPDRVFDGHLAPVEAPDGRIVAHVAVLRDVTNERRMEARLRRAEKLEALGTLASGTAHDFNNVLASILAVAEVTGERTEDPAIERSMGLIVAACHRARDVVRQVMVLGRRGDLGTERTFFAELLDGALPLLRAALPANVRIETDLAGDAPILARAADLDQVVTNLATNAAHAMGDEPSARLTLATRVIAAGDDQLTEQPGLDPARDHVELTVADTGHGIAPEHLDDIFDPFFTTKAVAEGNGLGLASVHAIVASLGGAIEVDSIPGEGTSFRILLPVAEDASPVEPPVPAEETSREPVTATVLFVDDEDVLRRVSAQALRKAGFAVVEASDGREALERCSEGSATIDVVVTDLTMPNMDGADLVRQLRELRPELPVILTSGYGEAAERRGLTPAQVAAYLAKPFTVAELVERIRAALARPTRRD